MRKRITKTYKVMKALYSDPTNPYIKVDSLWRKTNLKKWTVGNRLCWLFDRKLVEKIKETGYKDGHPFFICRYRLTKGD